MSATRCPPKALVTLRQLTVAEVTQVDTRTFAWAKLARLDANLQCFAFAVEFSPALLRRSLGAQVMHEIGNEERSRRMALLRELRAAEMRVPASPDGIVVLNRANHATCMLSFFGLRPSHMDNTARWPVLIPAMMEALKQWLDTQHYSCLSGYITRDDPLCELLAKWGTFMFTDTCSTD